jgi:hypothetical protein
MDGKMKINYPFSSRQPAILLHLITLFQNSLGENILMRPKSQEPLALLTTTRPVFAYSNRIVNANYVQLA